MKYNNIRVLDGKMLEQDEKGNPPVVIVGMQNIPRIEVFTAFYRSSVSRTEQFYCNLRVEIESSTKGQQDYADLPGK